ncbi:MAG: heme NO-binding domain-containing protein [Candidatus Krumholzibacteria bacterium]|nr:heme NO-binding domain-containing protein [Candidatus Krumholzibacteria bacterium]
MKGIINKGIEEFVTKKFGAETWEKIKSLAGCEEPFFTVSFDYPDEMTVALVKAASEASGLPMDAVMIDYGKYLVPNTLKENYPTYFKLAGSSPREFLLNMNYVHEHVTRNTPSSTPPKFRYEELTDGRLLMKYQSKRMLCPVLHGLILGVGILFDQELKVRETACMKKGDPECIMEVTFP